MNSLGFTELTPEGSFILLYLMPTLLPLIPCSILSMLTTESCHILPTHHGCLALSPSWLPCPLSIMAALPSNCHSCLALSPSWPLCPLSIMTPLPTTHHGCLALLFLCLSSFIYHVCFITLQSSMAGLSRCFLVS